jgi:hypothetical protein
MALLATVSRFEATNELWPDAHDRLSNSPTRLAEQLIKARDPNLEEGTRLTRREELSPSKISNCLAF